MEKCARSCMVLLYAGFTQADLTPQLCPDAVGSANVNGFPTRHRLSGPHREVVSQYETCSILLDAVIMPNYIRGQPGRRISYFEAGIRKDQIQAEYLLKK